MKDTDGLLGVYSDDFLFARKPEFHKWTEHTLQKFDSKPRTWRYNVEVLGVMIRTTQNNPLIIELGQPEFLSALTFYPLMPSMRSFSLSGLPWHGLHIADQISAVKINRAAQVNDQSFSISHTKELNKAICYAKATKDK